MKKLLILVVIFLCYGKAANSQRAISVFFEGGGPGVFSANFDARFTSKQNGIGGRVGFGGFVVTINGKNAGIFFVPLGVNYLFGNNERNFIEVGGGITPVIVSSPYSNKKFSSTFGHALVGYRYQAKTKGFSFRVFYSPIVNSYAFYPKYGGASVGFKFNGRSKH